MERSTGEGNAVGRGAEAVAPEPGLAAPGLRMAAPVSGDGAPFVGRPARVSGVGELQIGLWTPVYRSLAPKRVFYWGEEGGQSPGTELSPEQQRIPIGMSAGASFEGGTYGRAVGVLARSADRGAEEGFAIARQAGGVVAVERQAAPAGEGPPAVEAGTAAAEGAAARRGALEKLAQDVYELLRRRFQVERERAGLSAPWL